MTAPLVRGDGAVLPPVTVVATPGLRTTTRPLPHDLAQYRRVGSLELSPDGKRLVYAVRFAMFDEEAKPDEDAWKVEQQLFIVDRAGAMPRQLTFGDSHASSPRWSPDGRELAFKRARAGKAAIHILNMSGGEARGIDLGKLAVRDFAWSRDGRQLAFTAMPVLSDEVLAARRRSGGVERFDREWSSAQLYVITRGAGAEPRQVTRGDAHVVAFRWSPDGKRFALVTAESADPYHAMQLLEVKVVAADGGLVRDLITRATDVDDLAWSPDGRYLAHLEAEKTLSLHNVLRVHEVDTGKSWNAAAGLDPSLDGFVWDVDSTSLVAHVFAGTASRLYRLAIDGSRARALSTLDRVINSDPQVDASGRYLYAVTSTATTPPDPTVIDLKSGAATVLAQVNPQVADWTLGTSELVRWQNPEGIEIEGLLHVTPHAVAGQAPPLLVLPHGGPDAVSINGFSRWAHYFAARGYSVFRPNYRGGFGYGRAFYAANRGRFGEIEYLDIESGVDHLIATGKADPGRLLYAGWSWGGFITAWTITRSKRYRAAVVGAGIIDPITHYVTSDINHGVVADWEYKGRPWQQRGNFERSSPSLALANITTPTLILHGRADDRVDFINSQMLYRALVDSGCEVEFYAYPREPHSFGEPAHVAHLMEVWARWLDSHLP